VSDEPSLGNDRKCRANSRFRAQNQRPERDALPACRGKLFALGIGPAAFGADQQRGRTAGDRLERGFERRRARAFVAPESVRGAVAERYAHFGRRVDFGYPETPRLLAGFVGNAAPAFYPLLAALQQAAFTAHGRDRHDARDAQFGGLLDGPFEAVEFDQRQIEGNLGRWRPGIEFFLDLKPDQIAPGTFHSGQPDAAVIGNFKCLPFLHAKDAGEVLCALAGDFGGAVANLIYEESPSCHVQCLRYPLIPKMIALLRGTLIEKHPNQVIIEVGVGAGGGVGYEVTIPISTFSKLPEVGGQTVLRIHTQVREDIFALYGFLTQDEKTLFEKLIGVSNIGPGLAIKVLSGMAIDELINGIRRGEVDRLVRIPGVGRKTAERMVLELRDKLPAPAGEEPATAAPSLSSIEEDVMSALLNLGCARPAAETAVRKARAAGAPAEFEPLFRRSLELVR
jgi:Holliday junction DNA helicase RuvA